MKNPYILLFLYSLLPLAPLWSQGIGEEEEEELPLSERLYYSGGVDFQLGNATIIGLYPIAGYKFNKILSAGLGLSYQYAKYRAGTYLINGIPRSVGGNPEGQHTYGGKLFGRAKTPIDVFGHIEWETLNTAIPGLRNERRWFDAVLIGAGYSARMGGKSSINLMMLYNLNRSSNEALYQDEFVPRVEFSYNF